MLTPERWERLQALFTSAVDLPPDECAAFVARETAGDEDLGRELNGMLHQHSRAGERIARAIGQAAAAKSGAEWIGRRFGPYRIVREIGHGGMGLVFEAVRDDLEYQKTVALKVAPWYRDTPELRERFRLERQILASLEHPNIARLIDGGSSGGRALLRDGVRAGPADHGLLRCAAISISRRASGSSVKCARPSMAPTKT